MPTHPVIIAVTIAVRFQICGKTSKASCFPDVLELPAKVIKLGTLIVSNKTKNKSYFADDYNQRAPQTFQNFYRVRPDKLSHKVSQATLNCSDPLNCSLEGGRNYILNWVFFCSVNFRRSIYSS